MYRAYNVSGKLVKDRAAPCLSQPCLCKCNVNCNIYIICIYNHDHSLHNGSMPASPANALQTTVLHIILDNFKSAIKAPRQCRPIWSGGDYCCRGTHCSSAPARKSKSTVTFSISNQLIKCLGGTEEHLWIHFYFWSWYLSAVFVAKCVASRTVQGLRVHSKNCTGFTGWGGQVRWRWPGSICAKYGALIHRTRT